jgi:hypothetical protein
MLPATHQRRRLVRRRTLESVHSVDRSRSSISDPQERPVDSPDLASERRTCSGTHLRVLSLLTCCGKHWGSSVTKRAWAANLAGCFRNSPRSVQWMLCYRLAPDRKFEPAAFQSPRPSTNPPGKTPPQTAFENNPEENVVENFATKPRKHCLF